MRIPEFLLTQICTIKPYLGQLPTGKSFGTSYTAKCRFESYKSKVVDSEGKEFIGNGKLYLLPDEANFTLRMDSEVTIGSDTFTIVHKINHRGFTDSHVECVVL